MRNMFQDQQVHKDEQPVYDLAFRRTREIWNDKEGVYQSQDDDDLNDDERLTTFGNSNGEVSDAGYAFSIVKFFKPSINPQRACVAVNVHVRSPYFVEAAREIMREKRDIAWDARPTKFNAEELLSFLPQFNSYLLDFRRNPMKRKHPTIMHHLEYFVNFLQREYSIDLRELEVLKEQGLISFYILWGVMIPGTILVSTDEVTQDSCFVRLVSMEWCESSLRFPEHYSLLVEYIDIVDGKPGIAERTLRIPKFKGAQLIRNLPTYPAFYLADEKGVRRSMAQRGRRCHELVKNWCHVKYEGIAHCGTVTNNGVKYRKVAVKSRVVLDREMFDCHASYASPALKLDLDGNEFSARSRTELEEEEFMLFSPRLYGFCLSRREWLEFRCVDVMDIEWNPELFDQLELPLETKAFVRSMVEGQYQNEHSAELDFVLGKGSGLIFNLHVTRSPLWMIGAGDLGTTAASVDSVLSNIAELALRWKAVVLLDEADIFVEKRTSHDIKRNAIIAAFLRRLEYYPGILFFTTNRVEVFDHAIQARIHVSLYYQHLDANTKGCLWYAFLRRTDMKEEVHPYDIKLLSEAVLNGREIKMIVKTQATIAFHEGRPLGLADIMNALSAVTARSDSDHSTVTLPSSVVRF
ncbi:hypothetical protein D9758_005893 [Tetrapyrgos nigripes]|uniref:ATPase AAA-type core domain-containing protein n=1 Tax=Tetrapyrgos nigripes TaxID=182062 RepID=A0A8H5LH62_9AGAR|nr:hypothetical protein D9758_005893 [Tetrapyrgos nigripes]